MSIIKRATGTPQPLLDWPDERFDRTFRDMFRDFFVGSAVLERLAEGVTKPLHLEEFVEDGTCVIRAELPGIDPAKDVEITLQDGVLHLKGERTERKEEERPEGYRSEFRYGGFYRAIRLPEGSTEADVKATYKDGILEVRVPMATTPSTATRIAVEPS
jgi:HSP20 family protein